MDDEELGVLKRSLLKQLREEDLAVHSIDVLRDRVSILKAEIVRTEEMIRHKKTAHEDADSFFS